MTAITHLNYATTLKQSTNARASSPNGNVYFDVANNKIQLISSSELATITWANTATQINVNASAGTFTRLTGSFLADGFAAGMSITGSGFANGGNNVAKVISTVTATVITVTNNSGLVTETGSGDEVLSTGAIANPYVVADGITMRALYNFENARRRVDETLRKYKRGTRGDYRYAGAYNFVNGVKLDANDRNGIRGSGWQEFANIGDGLTTLDRVYHGIRSLVSIQPTTVSYWALVTASDEATLQAATWTNFVRSGPIDEAIQVYGTTANGDTGAGNFDYRTRELRIRVRSWQYTPGETTSSLSGISEFAGFSAGYGVGEAANPANTYTLADVYGGARIAPWTGMSLERLASPQVETGFNEADGNFRWVLRNTGGGTAQQCAAFLDAVTLQDSDIDTGAGTYNGKKGRVWYTRNSAGKIVTSSVGGEGLLIEGLSVAEKQNVIQTDDAGAQKTYPFFPELQITTSIPASLDTKCWWQVFYDDGAGSQDFDTANAVTVNDASGNPMKGYVSTDHISLKISRAYAYDTNTQAGLSAGADKAMVVLIEGDGGAAQALTYFTMTRSTIVAVTCAPPADTNA